jgi:prevent-host-death family protein
MTNIVIVAEAAMSATQVSVAQAKAEFAALVSRAEAGEEIIVTRNGKPVARLMALVDTPVVYGDLAGLRIDDDLSLPDSAIDEFMAR